MQRCHIGLPKGNNVAGNQLSTSLGFANDSGGFAMVRLLLSVRRFLVRESGHVLVEYLFMLSLILVAAILGIKVVGTTALDLFTTTKDALP